MHYLRKDRKMKVKGLDLPPNYFYLSILLAIALKFIFPRGNFMGFPYILIGIPFILVGLLLIAWTYKLFMKNKTPENFSRSKAVVKEGPYEVSRNPMYIGAVLFLIGISLLLGNYITFISPLILLIILNRFVLLEEKKIQRELGKEYLKYKEKTRRWI